MDSLCFMGYNHYCSYGERASQPCQPASLLQSFLQNNHVSHSDRHIIQFPMGRNLIKQQNSANVRSFILSQSASQLRTHISRRNRSQLISQIINQMDQGLYGPMGAGIAGIQNDEDVIFLCFLWAIVTNLACVILLPSPGWNNVVPEKDFKHSVAFSQQPSSQSPLLHSNAPYFVTRVYII